MWNRPKNRRKHNDGGARIRPWFAVGMPQVNWRRAAVTAGSLAGVAAVIGGVLWTLDQPIESVAVAGQFQRVSPADVERAVKQQVLRAGLVSVNLEAVRHAIGALSWVDKVTVERAWPHGLRVVVTEQIAAARWGESGLLNTRGELFASDARHVPLELAQLSGPDGTETVVAQRYLRAQGRLADAGMRLTALRLDARGAWEFDLANGVTVRLGRRQVDDRFERFMAAAMKLVAQRANDIAYVDMRYTNGFAIGWRGAVAPHPDGDDANDA